MKSLTILVFALIALLVVGVISLAQVYADEEASTDGQTVAGSQLSDEPQTAGERVEQGSSTEATIEQVLESDDLDAFASWLIALDYEYLCGNIERISNRAFDAADVDDIRDYVNGDREKAKLLLKTIIILQHANDERREPTDLEKKYIASAQMSLFGEASAYFTEEAESDEPGGGRSGDGSVHYTGPRFGTYPSKVMGGSFQKGLILITNDFASGSLPTGHAAILYDPISNTAMTSFPMIVSRNVPKVEGVQQEPNDWWDYHASCFVLKSNVTTAYQDALVADWCYSQTGKPYHLNFWDPYTQDKYYCSQLVWKGFFHVTGVNIGNADSSNSEWGTAVHPMELKRAPQTTLLYQHGTVDTGWVMLGGFWYYLASGDGHMVIDTWAKGINGIDWYYLGSDGKMVYNTWARGANGSDWFYLGSDGKMVYNTWARGAGGIGWYYLGSDGKMVYNTWARGAGGIGWYYLGSNGAMLTGWLSLGVDKYYLGSSGAMYSGLQPVGAYYYYFGGADDGKMKISWQTIGGYTYYFGGANDGTMKTGWQLIGVSWYLFDANGHRLYGWQLVSGKYYYLNSSGQMLTGWINLGGNWYYLKPGNGYMIVNRAVLDSVGWCYVQNNGAAARNVSVPVIPGLRGGRFADAECHLELSNSDKMALNAYNASNPY